MITSCLFYIFISWQIVNKMVMVDNISSHNIKSHQKCNKNTRKADRNCISWVVIGIKIICTERSQDLIIASIKRMIQLAVMQPPLNRGHVLMEWPLFRGHVQDWPLRRTCNQRTVETCFDATTSIQRTLWTDNSQDQVGGTIWTWTN